MRLNWVVGQKDYFKREVEKIISPESPRERSVGFFGWAAAKSKSLGKIPGEMTSVYKRNRYEAIVQFFTIASILFAVTILVLQFKVEYREWLEGNKHVHDLLILATTVCLLIAGFTHNYYEKRAYTAIANRYEGMTNLFANYNLKLINRKDNVKSCRNALRALGKEALVENGNWLLLYRERPLELPKG